VTSILILIGVVAVAGGLIWFLAKASEQKGAAETQAAQTKVVLDAVQDHKQAEDEIARTPIAIVRQRLSKWIARR